MRAIILPPLMNTNPRYDYGYVKDSVQGKQMLCHCKEPNCRGRMY